VVVTNALEKYLLEEAGMASYTKIFEAICASKSNCSSAVFLSPGTF